LSLRDPIGAGVLGRATPRRLLSHQLDPGGVATSSWTGGPGCKLRCQRGIPSRPPPTRSRRGACRCVPSPHEGLYYW